MDEIIKLIKQWFWEKDLEKADPAKQGLKLMEEVGELAEGIVKDDLELVVDSIGDITVVLIGLSLQLDLDFETCVRTAYNEIAERKGKVVNGVFVKEQDIKNNQERQVEIAHAEYTKAILENKLEKEKQNGQNR